MLRSGILSPIMVLAFLVVASMHAPQLRADDVVVEDQFAAIPEYRVFGSPPSPSDESAIYETMQGFGIAWGTQDVEGAVAAYTEDAEWTNAFADVYRGHDEIRAQFARLFERFESDPGEEGEAEANDEPAPTMKRGQISLRYIGNNAAVVHSYTESDWGMNRDGSDLRRVHITFVLERQDDGQWLIAHQMIMDARR